MLIPPLLVEFIFHCLTNHQNGIGVVVQCQLRLPRTTSCDEGHEPPTDAKMRESHYGECVIAIREIESCTRKKNSD